MPRVCRRAESEAVVMKRSMTSTPRFCGATQCSSPWRNMIVDERRSGRFHMVVSSLDGSHKLERPTRKQVNATVGVTR